VVTEELRRYLHGDIGLSEFEDYVSQLVWDLLDGGEDPGIAADIDLYLMEYSSGAHTEQQLKVILATLYPDSA
jgi:hypothetical protein